MPTSIPTWIGEVNATTVVTGAAEALGLERGRWGGWGPCPVCGAERRSRSDGRGPVTLYTDKGTWRCYASGCGSGGDVVALVTARETGCTRLPARDPRWEQVRARCAGFGWCSRAGDPAPPMRPLRRRPLTPSPPPRRPPPEEVAALWAACLPVLEDRWVSRWLADERGIDPATVQDLDLARAIPEDLDLPSWASCGKRPWNETGHRLLVPLRNAAGNLESFQARCIRTAKRKTLNPNGRPYGVTFEVRELVMTNKRGQELLRGALLDAAECVVVVSEGAPDWLVWSTRRADLPVLGVVSGSWTTSLAVHIPAGATVVVRTHPDDTGDHYAEKIRASLAGRCTLRRSKRRGLGQESAAGDSAGVGLDDNDLLKAGLLSDDPLADTEPMPPPPNGNGAGDPSGNGNGGDPDGNNNPANYCQGEGCGLRLGIGLPASVTCENRCTECERCRDRGHNGCPSYAAESEGARRVRLLETQAPLVGTFLGDAFERMIARAEGTERPVPTPWPSVNDALNGGLWDGVHLLVGCTGVMKTQWALQLALHAARLGMPVPVLYIGLEMGGLDLVARLLGLMSGERWNRLHQGQVPAHVVRQLRDEYAVRLAELSIRLEIGQAHGWSYERLASRVQALREQHPEGPLLVVLDFLQLVSAPEGERLDLRERITRASYAARMVARDHRASVLLVSSTAREHYKLFTGEKGGLLGDDSPTRFVGTGKESGDVEYSADTVLALCREQYREQGSAREPAERIRCWLAVAKGRALRPRWLPLNIVRGVEFADADEHGPPGAPGRGLDA